MTKCSDMAIRTSPAVTSADAATATQELISTDDVAGVISIFEPACQILQWRRGMASDVAQALDAVIASGALRTGFRVVVETEAVAEALPLFVPQLAPLRQDMAFLVEVYADLLGCPRVGLRLEYLHGAMCPRFHVDRTGIRMVCTYRGPGTEWLLSRAADRSRLGAAGGLSDDDSGLILASDGVAGAQAFDVLLLKGTLWQGNTQGGAIHRSPMLRPEQVPRLVVALDAVW